MPTVIDVEGRVVPPKTMGSVSRLAKVQKGRMKMPWRYIFYGDNGVGKSTLASHAPSPIWFDIEDGSGRLDVARYMFRDEAGGHVPQSYQEILSAISDLMVNEHDYKTLVIDTLDRLEALLWQYMVRRDNETRKPTKGKLLSIEDYGYAKGYTYAVDDWRALCVQLDRLRSTRGMSVILLGHSQIKTFKNPEGDDYDRYQLRINAKAGDFLREWADVTGFCCFEEGGSKLEGDRPKGWTTGKRLVRFQRSAAYDAKTRLVLPEHVELDAEDAWGPIKKAVDDAVDLGPKELKEMINRETSRIGDAELSAKVTDAVKKAGNDVEALARFLNGLKARPAKAP